MTGPNLARVDLNLLVVLETIHAEGGITRAAEKLHLSQPAISHALARLRETFDDPLFVRQGNTMVPTPFARRLLEPVRESLRTLGAAFAGLERFDPATSRKRFTVGLRAVMESAVLPALMQEILDAAPGVSVAAVRVDRRRVEADLAAGALDVALDVLLPVPDVVSHARLSSDRLVVVARRDHPGIGDTLGLDAYLQLDHVLVSARRRGMGLEDTALSRLGHRRTIRMRCQQYFAACRVVSRTDLVLTMPERQARITNREFDNRVLPLPLDGLSLDAYLYWHASADTDPANAWLRQRIGSAFTLADAGG